MPTTKLARTHYLAFPLICLLIALSCFWLWERLRQERCAWLAAGMAGTLLVAASEGLYQSHRSWEARFSLPNFLERTLPEVKTVLLLGQDPHAYWLGQWLAAWRVGGVDMRTFNPRDPRITEPVALVIGPSGVNSGNSLVRHGCLPDFLFSPTDYAQQLQAQIRTLAYGTYNPAFCMEEENMEGLLAEGKVPDPRKEPSKGLSVLWWPKTTPPPDAGKH